MDTMMEEVSQQRRQQILVSRLLYLKVLCWPLDHSVASFSLVQTLAFSAFSPLEYKSSPRSPRPRLVRLLLLAPRGVSAERKRSWGLPRHSRPQTQLQACTLVSHASGYSLCALSWSSQVFLCFSERCAVWPGGVFLGKIGSCFECFPVVNNLSHCRMLNSDCLERVFVTASRLMCGTSCFSKTFAYFPPSIVLTHLNAPDQQTSKRLLQQSSVSLLKTKCSFPWGCPMRWVLSHGSTYRCCCCGPVGYDVPFMLHPERLTCLVSPLNLDLDILRTNKHHR